MKIENIPLRKKFDQLVAGLAELEPIAAELAKDPIHKQSSHIDPVRSRLLAAIEGLGWHTKALAALPEPKAETAKPSTAPDATAGANAPK